MEKRRGKKMRGRREERREGGRERRWGRWSGEKRGVGRVWKTRDGKEKQKAEVNEKEDAPFIL